MVDVPPRVAPPAPMRSVMDCHYGVLKLAPTWRADFTAIQAAHKWAALEAHPDKHPQAEKEAQQKVFVAVSVHLQLA